MRILKFKWKNDIVSPGCLLWIKPIGIVVIFLIAKSLLFFILSDIYTHICGMVSEAEQGQKTHLKKKEELTGLNLFQWEINIDNLSNLTCISYFLFFSQHFFLFHFPFSNSTHIYRFHLISNHTYMIALLFSFNAISYIQWFESALPWYRQSIDDVN